MTDDPEDFWNNRFHWCALAAGFQAYCEGRLGDGAYLKELVYRSFERGEFKDRVKPPDRPAPSPPRLSPQGPLKSARRS